MNLTTKTIKTIDGSYTPTPQEILKLYKYAKKNRMGYYFLYILNQRKILPKQLKEEYLSETQRYHRIINAMTKLTEDLDNAGIEYAIFKSIRPYPSTTVDIDTIIFNKYKQAYITLRRKGYSKLGCGPETITLLDPTKTVGIDLYREIAVSRIIYLDKEKLKPYIMRKKLSNNREAQTLEPEADLITIVAHLSIKEQMYTLADYYTIIYHLKNIDMKKIWRIAEQTNTLNILKTILNTTLHIKNRKLPQKIYPNHHTAIEKIRDKKLQKSLPYQINYLLKTNNLKIFLKQGIEHIRGKTY